MKLSETENVFGADVYVRDGVSSREMLLHCAAVDIEFALDQQTAAELVPILQHFIETGELPE